MGKLRSFIKKQYWRYWVIILIFIALLAGIVILFILNQASNSKNVLTNSEILSNVYYFTQIITSVAIVIGGIIGIWQYTLTARTERAKNNEERIQRAIDLAGYYKDNILEGYAIIRNVFKDSGLMEIVNKIDKGKISVFDELELNRYLTEQDKEQIEEIINSEKFIQAVVQAGKIYNLNIDISEIATSKSDIDDIETNKEDTEINGFSIDISKKFMSSIVTDTLNNLEFFSMHFSHKTADESVVYQSLHQSYLTIVYVLYYNIAIQNCPGKSRYYTNIIELYKIWYNRNKNQADEFNKVRNTVEKGNIAEEING